MNEKIGNSIDSDLLLSVFNALKPVSEEDGKLITSYFELRSFKEGDYLFSGGKICNELFFICSGVLRILSTNEKGIDLTHYFYQENQLCTILASFSGEISTEESIQAACEARVLAIRKNKLEELYLALPYMKDLVDQLYRRQLLDKILIRNSYLGQDAESQYKIFMSQQRDIAIRVSLKDTASYLGITPQSLSRIRKHIR